MDIEKCVPDLSKMQFYSRKNNHRHIPQAGLPCKFLLILLGVKYKYIEFFAFDYDSLPISFQSGIAFFL